MEDTSALSVAKSYLDEIEKIGTAGNMGTREFFAGSSYPIRVFRLTPEDPFMVRLPDHPYLVRAESAREVMKLMFCAITSFYKTHAN